MRVDFTIFGQQGYACFDNDGECVQFVLFFWQYVMGLHRFPVAYGTPEWTEAMSTIRDLWLWDWYNEF